MWAQLCNSAYRSQEVALANAGQGLSAKFHRLYGRCVHKAAACFSLMRCGPCSPLQVGPGLLSPLQVHVGTPEGGMRADAAVNCGNTLASLAELVAGQGQAEAASRRLAEAETCYQAALRHEDDALVSRGWEWLQPV